MPGHESQACVVFSAYEYLFLLVTKGYIWIDYEPENVINPCFSDGWKEKHKITEKAQQEEALEETPVVGTSEQRSAWARLIKKVYGVDPLVCPKCGDYIPYYTSLSLS